jgi:CRP-like cAMP-binding protein
MVAYSFEPTLPWPTEGRRRSVREQDASASEWSSHGVARAEQPLARVAALLLSISHTNSYEGRDPEVIPDALSSGFVADLLGVDIATLATLLVDLRERGLIEPGADSTLRLKDVDGLEKLMN